MIHQNRIIWQRHADRGMRYTFFIIIYTNHTVNNHIGSEGGNGGGDEGGDGKNSDCTFVRIGTYHKLATSFYYLSNNDSVNLVTNVKEISKDVGMNMTTNTLKILELKQEY